MAMSTKESVKKEVKAEVESSKPKAKKVSKLIALKFVKSHAPYHKGEIAGFNNAEAKVLIDARIAKKN